MKKLLLLSALIGLGLGTVASMDAGYINTNKNTTENRGCGSCKVKRERTCGTCQRTHVKKTCGVCKKKTSEARANTKRYNERYDS